MTVFSHSTASESALIQMQSLLAQRSSVNKLVSSGRAQDHSQLTDSEGMTAHFPGLLFTTAWRLCSADSLHIAPPARVPGRECWLLAPSSHLSTQHTATSTDTQLQERVWCKSHPILSHGQMNPIITGHSHASNIYMCCKHTWSFSLGGLYKAAGSLTLVYKRAENTPKTYTSNFSKNWLSHRDTVDCFASQGLQDGLGSAFCFSATELQRQKSSTTHQFLEFFYWSA